MSELIAVQTDGRWRMVENSYESIKQGLNGATLDFVTAGPVGLFVDDNGMLEGLALNVAASMFVGGAIYGPVVLCAAEPDRDGDTVAAPPEAVEVFKGVAEQWLRVVRDAARKGQWIVVYADPDTIPPAVITSFDSAEAFMRWLEGER